MSMEALKSFCDWAAIVFVFLTFIAGTGALITGNILNDRQAEQLRKFDKDLTDAKRALTGQQERAAALEVEALSLRKELLRQGSRENLMSGNTRIRLVDALKPFAGQVAEVRFGRSAFGTIQNVPDPAGNDVMGLANALIGVLREAAWKLPIAPPQSVLQGPPGITVQVSPKVSRHALDAANMLVTSLREVPLEVQGPLQTDLPANPRIGTLRVFTPDVPGGPATEKPLPSLTDETIVLTVLAHPK